MVILNRMDLADPELTARWIGWFQERGSTAIAMDCKNRRGTAAFVPAAKRLLQSKLERDAAKGMTRPLRWMVVGIPNVGKSTFINQISGRKGAKAENRPGVTRGKQWITVDSGLLLLDTPGILWPKFEDVNTGLMLAYTGAVKENVLDTETLACKLMELLWQRYPDALRQRYALSCSPNATGWELLEAAGRKRGFLLGGGEIHLERMAKTLLDEFRSGKLGRFTLECPEEEG